MRTAATSPSMRAAISGPMPMPSRRSSVAGVAMLFHSPMSRMKKTLPDAVDGESEPKTAADAPTTAPSRPGTSRRTTAAAERDGRHARSRGAPCPPAVPGDGEPEAARTSRPSFRDSVARPASRPARTNARGGAAERPGAPSRAPRRRAAGTARSCPAGRGRRPRAAGRREDAGADGDSAVAPASRAIAQVSGAAMAPMSAKGAAAAHGVRRRPRGTAPGRSMPGASSGRWTDRQGRMDRDVPPTSAKIQMKSMLKPWPAWRARATST